MKKRPIREVRSEIDSLDYQLLCSQIICGDRATEAEVLSRQEMRAKLDALEKEYPRARVRRMTSKGDTK